MNGLLQVEPSVQKLYDYIYERGTIVPIDDYSMELLSHGDISKRVTESIRQALPAHALPVSSSWHFAMCQPLRCSE